VCKLSLGADFHASPPKVISGNLQISLQVTASGPVLFDFATEPSNTCQSPPATVRPFLWANGNGDGEFDQPHALAFDSTGLLYVGDRNNNRVQVFDQEGNFKEKFYQFGRPSGIYIDKNDILYVADSESASVSQNHQDWQRGIRIGSLKDKDKKVTAFIPDPETRVRPAFTNTSAAEGDTDGASLVFPVRLSGPSALPVEVAYTTAGVSANARGETPPLNTLNIRLIPNSKLRQSVSER